MNTFLAEDFRKLVDRLNEYIIAVDEDDKKKTSDDLDKIGDGDAEETPDDPDMDADDADAEPEKDVDDLLTAPASVKKLVGSIDIAKMSDILSMSEKQRSVFSSAIQALKQGDAPNHQQTVAIATAFINMLTLAGDDKTKIATMIRPITAINEKTKEMAPAGGIDELEKVIKDAAETAPTAKLHAIKLVKSLSAGMKDRHADGGIDHVMAGVTDAINLAKDGNHAASLKRISDLVAHVEGDDHAINVSSFPELVVDLILLTGEIGNRKSD